jgi:hypothetical protein
MIDKFIAMNMITTLEIIDELNDQHWSQIMKHLSSVLIYSNNQTFISPCVFFNKTIVIPIELKIEFLYSKRMKKESCNFGSENYYRDFTTRTRASRFEKSFFRMNQDLAYAISAKFKLNCCFFYFTTMSFCRLQKFAFCRLRNQFIFCVFITSKYYHEFHLKL